jgi:hypothetical protein
VARSLLGGLGSRPCWDLTGHAALSLLFVGTFAGVLVCLGTIGRAGWLFWKLIRAMARIQMPERPSARG